MRKTLFIICFCFLFVQCMVGQQDVFIGQFVELRTEDGNTYVGEVLSLTESEISVLTNSLGEITLKRANIKKVTYKNQNEELDKNGFPIDYYNSTHYFINQSGYSLKKGQSYYENVGVFFNSYSVGITDNFSITGGIEIATLLFGQSPPSLFVTPKFTIPFGEGAGGFSVGSTVFVIFVDNGPYTVGVAQAAATFGTRNNNFTIGSGIGFSFEDGIAESVVPFNLSGMWRLSKKISFMTDNFIISYDDFNDFESILSAGIRLHFEGGSALNLGLFRPLNEGGDFLAFPFISATIPLQ